jgi:hypothetical protein
MSKGAVRPVLANIQFKVFAFNSFEVVVVRSFSGRLWVFDKRELLIGLNE